jgi:spore cortex formation protein SpoVR/YcgB (stage V sporulation)
VERAQRVLRYVDRVWRRPVRLHTVDERGRAIRVMADDIAD